MAVTDPDQLRSILEAFVCTPNCPNCDGGGIVCEEHPQERWPEHDCGAAGMPCNPDRRDAE